MFKVLDDIQYTSYISLIISGGARGADQLAIEWAKINGVSHNVYPADWYKYGRSAGYIRNSYMLNEGQPDLVVAFRGGFGTKNMVDISRRKGVEVREIL